jgi:hypothetical protein
VGHVKPTMTYGLYGGLTRMNLRAEWLEKAIRYPVLKDGRRPVPAQTEPSQPAPEPTEPPPAH